ncbi:hypothetical protein NQ314_012723 [Rhamnusium bicolor]|uniref:Uncharacterized protein n=1 Tax=Rhamnusium bicolor TaxID=1586634 RepID=A0AAV8X9P9_9CUCU|nr:hypothetical protein NQ314_012723 [Rhamnusium bicolor]
MIYMATGNAYKSIAYSYRVSPRSVARCVKDVYQTLWLRLQPQFMPDPTTEDLKNTAAEFKKKMEF